MTTIKQLIERYNNPAHINFNDWKLDKHGARMFHMHCKECSADRGYQRIRVRDRLCTPCLKLSQIKKRNTHNNMDYSDFKVMKSGQRHYRVFCHGCGDDRGYQEARQINKKCPSCSAFKIDNPSVDRSDYKTIEGSRKYKTYCPLCRADKGYLQLQDKEYNCHKCAMSILSKSMTKRTLVQKKIKHAMSSNVHSKLKRRHLSKNNEATFANLPYSLSDLIIHLESLFEPWMSWDNHGVYNKHKDTWQIDHKIPDSWFIYSSMDDIGFQESWALINLQPLKALSNISKGNRHV